MKITKNGFVSIVILLFFSVFMTSILILIASAQQIKIQKMLFQKCQMNGLKYQHEVSVELNKLLTLNPRAALLITQKKIEEALLAEAILTGNVELIPVFEARIAKIKISQTRLATKQNKHLYIANTLLNSGAQKTYLELQTEMQRIPEKAPVFQLHPTLMNRLHGKIPIQATSLEIAPIYEPILPAESISMMDHSWQWQIQLAAPWNSWITTNWRIKKQCLVGIKFKNQFSETTVVKL